MGATTDRSLNAAFQPRRFTSYERDGNGSDEAMYRRYSRSQARFEQPDPYDGSYSLTDPQSLNRYAYVGNDPVNFADPTGLQKMVPCFNVDTQRWEQCEDDDGPADVRVEQWVERWRWDAESDCRFALNSRFGGYNSDRSLGGGPRNPTDGDITAVNNALIACGIGAGIGEYSNVNPAGTMWKGRNGQWYGMGWGGNGSTGGRSVAVNNANSFKLLGRASFAVGAGFSGYQGYQAYQKGDTAGAGKAGLDIFMSGIGTFGGPKGLIVAGVYFGIDTFVGWENCLAFASAPCGPECRRK